MKNKVFSTALIPLIILTMLFAMLSFANAAEVSKWKNLANAMAGGTYTDCDYFTVSDQGDTREIKLLSDVSADKLDEALYVKASSDGGKDIILDLNGCTVDRGLTSAEAKPNGSVIIVNSGAKLTINDSTDEQLGTITGGSVNGYGGGVSSRGGVVMNGGCVANNYATMAGGGIYSQESLVVNDGKIINNIGYRGGSGLFLMSSKSDLIIHSGIIKGNLSTISSTIMSNNSSVYLIADKKKSITITDNRAYTGVIGIRHNVYLSGKIIIKNNTSSTPTHGSNLFIVEDAEGVSKYVCIAGSIEGSSIPFDKYSTYTMDPIFTKDYSKYCDADFNKYFHYDGNDTKYPFLNKDGEIEFGEVPNNNYLVRMGAFENGLVKSDKYYSPSGETVSLTATPDSGYELDKVTVKDASGNPVPVTNNKFTMPAKSVTVSATFKLSKWNNLANAMAGGAYDDCDYFTVSDQGNAREIKLLSDVSADKSDEALYVKASSDGGKDITLDLNGCTVDRGLTSAEAKPNGSVIIVNSGAKLTINDSTDEQLGTITGGSSIPFGGGIHSFGEVVMNGGCIAHNYATAFGGGIHSLGTLVVNDGKILNNYAARSGGGLFLSSSKADLIVRSGIIKNNFSSLTGSVISNASDLYLVADKGKSIVITDNLSNTGCVGAVGEIYLSGKIIIKNNKNVYPVHGTNLGSSEEKEGQIKKVYIIGNIDGSDIFFDKYSLYVMNPIFSEGYSKYCDADFNKYFHYDGNDTKYPFLNKDGEIEFGEVPNNNYLVRMGAFENGLVKSDKYYSPSGETVSLTATPDSGYELDKVTVKDASGNPVPVTNNKFTMPAKSVTVSAAFKKKSSPEGGSKEEVNPSSDDDSLPKFENRQTVLLKAKAIGNNKIKLTWNKIAGATRYDIYASRYAYGCRYMRSADENSIVIKKIKGKKLKPHKGYRFRVVAHTPNTILKSKTIRAITANTQGKYGNTKTMKIEEQNLNLTVGETSYIKIKYKIYKNKKHIEALNNRKKYRYFSTCRDIVTVNRLGMVTAVNPGEAKIFVQDISGKYCEVTATVK